MVVATSAAVFSGSWWAILLGPRNVHRQLPALEFFAVEHFNRFVGFFRRGHLDKSETPGFAREFVEHHIDGADHARLREVVLQIARHGLIRKVANEKSGKVHLDWWSCARKPSGEIPHPQESWKVARNCLPDHLSC